MHSLIRQAFDGISGEWQLNLESRVPLEELRQSRIHSSKPSLGFFVLLVCCCDAVANATDTPIAPVTLKTVITVGPIISVAPILVLFWDVFS